MALVFTHRPLQYQLLLSGGFGRGHSFTTESFLYVVEALPRACLHPEARAHSAEWEVGKQTRGCLALLSPRQTPESPFPDGGIVLVDTGET